MARIEDHLTEAGGDWGGVEGLADMLAHPERYRVGWAQNAVLLEVGIPQEDGTLKYGTYKLPHVEDLANFS